VERGGDEVCDEVTLTSRKGWPSKAKILLEKFVSVEENLRCCGGEFPDDDS